MVEEHTWTSKKFDGLSSIIQKTNKLQLSLSFYLFSCFFYINSGVRSTKDISIPRKSRELSGRERYILVSQISFWIGSELSCFFLLRTHTTVDVLHITQHLNHTSSFSTCFLVETSFWVPLDLPTRLSLAPRGLCLYSRLITVFSFYRVPVSTFRVQRTARLMQPLSVGLVHFLSDGHFFLRSFVRHPVVLCACNAFCALAFALLMLLCATQQTRLKRFILRLN